MKSLASQPLPERIHDEVLERLDATSVDALAVALLGGGSGPAGRVSLAHALLSRFRAKRSAPAALMPRLRALLTDPDEKVVTAAVNAAVHAGEGASAVADELARIAASGLAAGPKPADGLSSRSATDGLAVYPEPASTALTVLVRLDDRRWREPMLAAWSAGCWTSADPLLDEYVPQFDPVALDGMRRRITALLSARVPR